MLRLVGAATSDGLVRIVKFDRWSVCGYTFRRFGPMTACDLPAPTVSTDDFQIPARAPSQSGYRQGRVRPASRHITNPAWPKLACDLSPAGALNGPNDI